MSRPHLYINSKGYEVTRHSYSGSESYNYCARKYYLERVQGWHDREQRSSTAFGIALEHAITFWHQRGQDTAAAVAEFNRLWADSKDLPLTYTKDDKDWERLSLTGGELVRLYAIKYTAGFFPYIVDNPDDAFQVERNVEVFPDTKLHGITFTAYLDLVATWKETGDPFFGDIKTSGKEVPEFTEMDPQLRSYAWITGWRRGGFIWFRKMGRTISRGDRVTVIAEGIAGLPIGTEAVILAKDPLGWMITTDPTALEAMQAIKGESKVAVAEREMMADARGTFVTEAAITKQRVEFKAVVFSEDSVEDIGRAVKRDIVNIVRSTELDFFPMQSGVRFPNEKCPKCPMRGICANRPELRDALVERKAVDELDLVKIEE